jgi:hypothetical protein
MVLFIKYFYAVGRGVVKENWRIMARNLMSLFWLNLLKCLQDLLTVRSLCIVLGFYLFKWDQKTTLILSVKDKRNQYLQELFVEASNVSPPFQISNAKIGININVGSFFGLYKIYKLYN